MEKNKLKKFLKTTTISLFICFGALIVWAILRVCIWDNADNIIHILKLLFLAVVGAILTLDLFAIIYYGLISIVDKKERIENSNYERDIPKALPPAIASLLIDYIMDNEREYTATVASLIAKGYIEIKENRQVRIYKWDKEKLLEHEKIVFEALSEEKAFNGEMFKSAVINDALKIGVLKRIEKKYFYLIPIFALIIIIEFLKSNFIVPFLLIQYFIYGLVLFLFLIFIIIMLIFSINKQPNTIKGSFTRTDIGKEIAIKMTGLKKFLHDYTLLKEKGLADTILYDEYIAFAIALGEADAIENLILNNTKYRNLVYKKEKESNDPIQRFY